MDGLKVYKLIFHVLYVFHPLQAASSDLHATNSCTRTAPPHLRTLVIAVSSSKEEFDDAISEESLLPFVRDRRPGWSTG